MSFVDSLYPLVITGDAVGARDLLLGLEDKELIEAKAWFAKAGRWFDRIPSEAFGLRTDQDLRHSRWDEGSRIMALCAVELCGPATAAKRVPWDHFWPSRCCAATRDWPMRRSWPAPVAWPVQAHPRCAARP